MKELRRQLKSIKLATNNLFASQWAKSARFFARGNTKTVFRKKETKYPIRALLENGNVVKIIPGGDRKRAKVIFWEWKIIHTLFPENTPRPRGVLSRLHQNGDPYLEIHIDEIPVHKELADYQALLERTQAKGHNSDSPESRKCIEAFKKHLASITLLQAQMQEAGVDVDINPTNISLAEPTRPVFLEAELTQTKTLMNKHTINRMREQVIDYMYKYKYPEDKKRVVLRYFEAMEKLA